MFTFILKTALYSKLNRAPKGWYHFPIWIPAILPDWVSGGLGNAPQQTPVQPEQRGSAADPGLRLDFNLV